MKKIYIPNNQVRELLENVTEYYDTREGVVMDSYYGILNNGREFVALDTCETAWTSGLTVYVGTEKELVKVWDKFTAAYDKEYGEEC